MIGILWRYLIRLESLLWILLLALSATVISGMGMLVRGLNYPLLIIVTLVGLVLGRMLARIRAPWWLALLLAIGSGFQTIIILVGHLFPLLWAVVKAIIIYLITLWWGGVDPLPNPAPLQTALQDLMQGANVVLTRLWTWLISLGEKGTLDPLPVQLVWGWALWIAVVWAAYLIWQNRQALVAVIPLGALLTIALFFTGVNNATLSAFLFLALTLQTGNSWKRRLHRWQTNETDWATDLAQDVAFAAGSLICLIVILSTFIPEISLTELIHKLQFQRRLAQTSGQGVDNVAASLGIEPRQPRPIQSYRPIIPSGLPRHHLLGSGPELTEKLVMLIKTDDPPPASPYEQQFGGRPPPAYYSLAATFDIYNGRGWLSSPTTVTELAANDPQLEPQKPGRTVSQTVRILALSDNLLFTIGFPLQVDQPGQITLRSHQDWAGTILETKKVYTAQSWLPQPTPDELEAAGIAYPEWIAARYLALPEKLPARVRALALELTATAPTPYDRALALERYLRTIPYSLDIPQPPSERDVVDYFLFDLQQGYCDYYATSMAVLARAAGLPARFVIGYAPSPYDYKTNQYVVREAEAHSWTQVYFPDYGWIDFEPTAGRAPINRFGEGENEAASLSELPSDFDLTEALLDQQGWWYTVPLWQLMLIGLTSLGSVVMVGLLVMWGRDQWLRRLPAEQLIPMLESRLEQGARLLGTQVISGATPLEFQATLLRRLERLAKTQPVLQKIIPSPADIVKLVNTFVYLRYAPQPVTAVEANTCLNTWRHLRWRLWGTIIVKKLRRIS
jgi:transglutaminase-like putative cysteine protease